MKRSKIVLKGKARKTTAEHAEIVAGEIIGGVNEAMDILSKQYDGMTPNDLMSGVSIGVEALTRQMAKAYDPAGWALMHADMLQTIANELLHYASFALESNSTAKD